MTIDELRSSDKIMLSPKDVAPILGVDPYTISLLARDMPEKLGFHFMRSGNRTKIPRKAFLAWLGEEIDGA